MYRRLFFSRKTALIAFIVTVLIWVPNLMHGNLGGMESGFDLFDSCVTFALSILLFYGYWKHRLPVMEVACAGLLISTLYYQADYVFNSLLSHSFTDYFVLGFWGNFFIAGEMLILILQGIITTNFFAIHVLKKKNFLRVVVNQSTILICVLVMIFQMYVDSRLSLSGEILHSFGIYHVMLVSMYVLFACSELILALDGEE